MRLILTLTLILALALAALATAETVAVEAATVAATTRAATDEGVEAANHLPATPQGARARDGVGGGKGGESPACHAAAPANTSTGVHEWLSFGGTSPEGIWRLPLDDLAPAKRITVPETAVPSAEAAY